MNLHDHLKELKTAQSSSSFTDNNNAAKKSELCERSGSSYCLIRFVKLFTQLVCLYFTIILADAATTTITVEGQQYTVTYETTRYDGNASQFKSTQWWGDSSTAKSFAKATSESNISYAFGKQSSFGVRWITSRTSNGSGGSSLNTFPDSFDIPYAISSVAVPAPLPILGILPVVGFLKRMRKRQHS